MLKILNFTLWLIAAPFVLFGVFIAVSVFPKWEEWGKDF